MVTTESVGAIARARPNGIRGRANLCTTSRSTQAIHGKPGHWKEMTVVPVEPRVPVSWNAPGSGRHSAGTWCVDRRVGLRAAIFTPFGTPIHHALGLRIAWCRPTVGLTHLILRNRESVRGRLASGGQITHFGKHSRIVVEVTVTILVQEVCFSGGCR